MGCSEISISMVLCTIWDWDRREWGLKRERGGAFSESTRKHWFKSFRYCGGSFSSLTNDDIKEGSSDSIVHAKLRARLWNSSHSTSRTLLRFLVLPWKARTRLGGCHTRVRCSPTQLPARWCRVLVFFFFLDLRQLGSICANLALIRTKWSWFDQNRAILVRIDWWPKRSKQTKMAKIGWNWPWIWLELLKFSPQRIERTNFAFFFLCFVNQWW